MGQKVHPKSLRLGVIQHNWESNWIADPKQYATNVIEDYNIRQFLKKRLNNASVSRFEIDRKAQRLIIRIITARPGMVVGRGGQGLDSLRKALQGLTHRKDIQLDVLEVARVDIESQLVAESIAQQLEKRIAFRRAMKQAMQRAMRSGAKGIKVMVSGRLGGAEIARTEWAKEGRIPLHTFRADIDYGFAEAMTVFGIIGVKVWVFKGEVLQGDTLTPNIKAKGSPDDAGSQQGPMQGRRGRGNQNRPGRRGRGGKPSNSEES
jgi:small subunit ribosomal protein S3